jgi:hypothetical protein
MSEKRRGHEKKPANAKVKNKPQLEGGYGGKGEEKEERA